MLDPSTLCAFPFGIVVLKEAKGRTMSSSHRAIMKGKTRVGVVRKTMVEPEEPANMRCNHRRGKCTLKIGAQRLNQRK